MDLISALAELGGVAHHRTLAASGFSRELAGRAARAGRIVRVRQGWFATKDAPIEVVRAVRVGGAVTCLSVLRSLGVWCVDDERLHVRVDPGISHLGSPSDRSRPLGDPAASRVVVHRTLGASTTPSVQPVDTLEDALMQVVVCQPREHAIAAFDSALQLGLTTRPRLTELAARLRARHRVVLGLADHRAQSGLETMARLRLRALGIPYRTQVHIGSVGTVDLLVGDRLVIELDGKKWHSTEEAFAEDRRRDLELHDQRYLPMRYTYAQVMFHWPRIEKIVRTLVAHREHRWGARHRQRELPPHELPTPELPPPERTRN